MTIQTTKDAMLALMRFGAACFAEHREDITDLDGCWLQETAWLQKTAIEVGLLEAREINEPCGADCRCDDFPTECLFPRAGVSLLLGGDNLINAWHELCNQRDAALKLADDWEGRDIIGWACADELRAIFTPKDGK